MKKLRLIIVILFLTINLFGQDRVNREVINFDKTSKIINSATGWSYNTIIGEWVENKNVISNDKKFKRYQISQFQQNFESIQIKTINIEQDTFFVILVDKYYGYYLYPNLREDWVSRKKIEAFIFDKNEFKKLINLTTEKTFGNTKYKIIPNVVNIKTKYKVECQTDPFVKYSEIELLQKIQTEIKTKKNDYSPEYEMFAKIIKTEDNLIARFRIPNYTGKGIENFEENYFEIDGKTFFGLINF